MTWHSRRVPDQVSALRASQDLPQPPGDNVLFACLEGEDRNRHAPVRRAGDSAQLDGRLTGGQLGGELFAAQPKALFVPC